MADDGAPQPAKALKDMSDVELMDHVTSMRNTASDSEESTERQSAASDLYDDGVKELHRRVQSKKKSKADKRYGVQDAE